MNTRGSSGKSTIKIEGVPRVNWTQDIRKILIDIVLEHVQSGNIFTDSGFKSKTWQDITTEFNKRTSLMYSKIQLQSQFSELKKSYLTFKALKENSGFGFDEVRILLFIFEYSWMLCRIQNYLLQVKMCGNDT